MVESLLYCKDKVFFQLHVFLFSVLDGGHGGALMIKGILPVPFILNTAPTQRRRNLCGAVCFVVHVCLFGFQMD